MQAGCEMLCHDTGSTEVVHIPGMCTAEAKDIGNALKLVRSTEHGSGEVCIPLINGIFKKIRTAIDIYTEQHKRKVN